MDHLSEVISIVRAAWVGDRVRAAAYIRFLSDKLAKGG
jgi:hypothetical protein